MEAITVEKLHKQLEENLADQAIEQDESIDKLYDEFVQFRNKAKDLGLDPSEFCFQVLAWTVVMTLESAPNKTVANKLIKDAINFAKQKD